MKSTSIAARIGVAALVATLAGSALSGGAAAASSPPSSAMPAGSLAPGLYVQVVDGMIHVTNGSGQVGFSAGQFGFVPTTVRPPVLLPGNPGLIFSPPPTFLSQPAQAAATEAAQPGAAASLLAEHAAAAAATAQTAAHAARAAADTLAAEALGQENVLIIATRAAETANQAAEEAGRAASDAAAAAENAVGTDDEVRLRNVADALAEEAVMAAEAAERARSAVLASEGLVGLAQAASTAAAETAARRTLEAEQAESLSQQRKREAEALLAAVPPALPATVPPANAVQSQPVVVAPSQAMLLLGAGFMPGSSVAFGMFSTPLGVAPVVANAQGVAVASFQIPAHFSGTHSLVAVGTGTDGLMRTLRMDISVSGQAALPATGADSAAVVALAANLTALGTLALTFALISRRRRRAV
ncbi:hypothetical protein [Homoserinimonas hongtaonis]|uniref:hypothetical protein n=1 Tax=Homoserinimonas hongtaonis TaxID=2079791 RepID=UPI000D34D970|nr:hypothetical protein [Salinibacterium hongtaonis]AWB88684.1 hypothetical protein C2138_03200 [Salinibacterium hongtaonis]